MNAFLEGLAVWLGDFYLLATVLLLAVLLARLLIRQPGPRVALAWGTWLGLVAIALLTALPAWPRYTFDELANVWKPAVVAIPIEPQANVRPTLHVSDEISLGPLPIAVDFAFPVASESIAINEPSPTFAWNQAAAAAWLVAGSLALAWMMLGAARARNLLSRASKVSQWVRDELKRIVGTDSIALPGLWASRDIESAVALGVLSPQIVLPQSSVAESNAPAVRAALAHEWAHIRHGDLWLLAIERLLLPLLAVHPLFWWLRRSVRLDQELLADAAAAGQQPVEYAEALLSWARSAQPARHGLAALAMWENPNTLSRRVSMILDPKRPRVSFPSRWKIATTILLLAPAVVGLSLLTRRPLTAQEENQKPPPASDVESVPAGTKNYREVAGSPRATTTAPITQVHMDLVVMSVNREKLAAAETTLEDEIAAATESRCRREAGLVVADVAADEILSLLKKLRQAEAVKVLSEPKIVTLDGREAVLHVGGEAPILRVEETINGKHERRVEYKEFGTIVMVRPKLDANEKEEFVRLDIVAEQSNLLPPGEKVEEGAVPRDVPGLVSHKFRLTEDVKLGGSLLVAESPADKKQLRAGVKDQFLLVITPQRAVRTVAAVYSDPAAAEKGEAARAATKAAIEAAVAANRLATQAEPPQPPAEEATDLQKAIQALEKERAERREESAELKRQIEDLEKALAERGGKTEFFGRLFDMKGGDAKSLAARFDELIANSSLKGQKIAVNFKGNQAEVYAPAELMDEVTKLIQSLGGEPVRGRVPVLPTPSPVADPSGRAANDPDRKIQTTRTYRLRNADAASVAQRLKALLKQSAAPDTKVEVDGTSNSVIVAAQEEHWPDITKVMSALDRSDENGPKQLEVRLYELDLAQAKLALDKAEKEYGRVEQLRAQGVIGKEQTDEKRVVLAQAKIEVQRAEAKLQAASAAAQLPATPPVTNERAGASRRAEMQLLELDLADAKLAVEEAETELARVSELAEKNAASQQEVRKYRFQLDRAKIQMQRIMIKLEAAKEPSSERRY